MFSFPMKKSISKRKEFDIKDILDSIEDYENRKLNFKINESKFKKDLVWTIKSVLENNDKIIFKENDKMYLNDFLVLNSRDLLDVFYLRYLAFEDRNYNVLLNSEFRKWKLNFDGFDRNSFVLKYSRNEKITGTTRIIFDGEMGLYSESNYDGEFGFNSLRNLMKIAEISRSAIIPECQSSGIEFKNLFRALYYFGRKIDVDCYVTAIAKEDYKLYKKLGFEIMKKDFGYKKNGTIEKEVLFLKWEIRNVNSLFKRLFLK